MSRSLLAAVFAAGLAGSALYPHPALARHASSGGDGGNDPVIAEVNGQEIHRSELEMAVPPEQRSALSDPKVFAQVRSQIVARKIAYQEAVREGLQNSAEVKREEAMLNQQIVAKAYLDKISDPSKITDAQMHEVYDQLVKGRSAEEEFHLRQIEVKTEDEAKDIIKQLDDGGDFVKLAKEKSINKGSGQDGGDIGYVGKSMLDHFDHNFAEAAAGMQPNAYTKTPIKIESDYRIFQVLDHRQGKVETYDELKPKLKPLVQNVLVNQKLNELAAGHVQLFNFDGSPATPPSRPGPAPSGAASAPSAAGGSAPAGAAPQGGPALQLPQTQSPQ